MAREEKAISHKNEDYETIGVKESLLNNVLLYDKCIPNKKEKEGKNSEKFLYRNEHHQHFYEILIKRPHCNYARLKFYL